MRGRGSRVSVELGQVNWRSLKLVIPYLLEFRGRIVIALLCLVGAKLASVGLPFILKNVVDQLNNANNANPVLVVPLALLLAYGLVRFANVLFGEVRDTIFGRVTERAMRRVGYRVFTHLHSLDLAYHLNRRTGGVSRDIERGVTGISFIMRFMVFNIVPTFLEIIMVVGLLLWNYSYGFALIVLVSVIAYVLFSFYATEKRTAFIREMNAAESKSSTRSVDSLLNYETVKYFNNEAYEAEHYDKGLEQWEFAKRRNRLSLFVLNGGQSFIIAAAITAAMIMAATQVTGGQMTIGDFVLINALMMQVFLPLNFLGFVYREMKGSMANIDAMFSLLNIKPAVQDADKAEALKIGKGQIEFRDVGFSYQEEREILKGVDFSIAAKQKVAIVGSSGSGKSTIMKLLFRFYDVKQGSVLVDGQDIRSVTQQSLRKEIAVVPQDTVLFNASIFENIRYGDVSATDDQVWDAIRMSYLEEFIEQLPKGADTIVGERGLKLSGGERQRVAIARAILKNPSIMIFDEATSSLDSHSEQRILQAMTRIQSQYTSVVIAHRLSTIVDADQILVLDQGQIVERGSHSELLALRGQYAKLWQIQNTAELSNS